MFTVIVVDDEPTALNHMCTIIKMKCPQFEIVATAENGKEGFDQVYKHKPDLVITDVKMPVMNGIELVTKVKENFPDIDSIIVSGYDDFEYAKGAIKMGVFDYILKPVSPNNLKTILDEFLEKLSPKLYQQRNKLIRSLSRGMNPQTWEIKKYFPSERYYAAIVRRNGLPRRFSGGLEIEIFSKLEEMILIYGRDEMEALYICPQELVFTNNFEDLMKDIIKKSENDPGYTTAIISKQSFDPTELPEQVKKLHRMLDKKTIIGHSQILILEEIDSFEQTNLSGQEDVVQRIEYFIKEKQFDNLKKELRRIMMVSGQEKRSQLWLEGISRQVLFLIQKYHTGLYDDEYEFMLEDAFFYATSMEELIDSLFFILSKYMDEENNPLYRLDTPEFFASIKEYLKLHMAEQITLQSVCKVFGVSQTYLSKLFRKYGGQSLNSHLTSLRIERAKILISENPEIFIKDVAAMVGYNDQFYFSRIFRSLTGMCPSDFIGTVE